MTTFSLKDILAVVVVYGIKAEECNTLFSLNANPFIKGEKLDVCIYDNSVAAQNLPSSFAYQNLCCTYYHDIENPGVSKAYNYAAHIALQRKKKFLLLLDQDTFFPDNAIDKYVRAINRVSNIHLFCPILKTAKGIFSPAKYHFRRGHDWSEVTPGIHSLKNRSVLNSGLLINVNAYQAVGGYNEKIKLYFSDFDFINRFRKKYNEMMVIDLVCFHSLSDIDVVDYSSAIRRFRYYVNGSYNSIQSFTDFVYLFVTIFLRAVKLSWRYKRLKFIFIFLQQYVTGGRDR